MSEIKITCPQCKQEFELTETLAGPAIAAMREQVQAEARVREKALKEQAIQEARSDVSVELVDLKNQLAEENEKRKKAERAELQLRNEAIKLQDDKERWELEKQRILSAERDSIRESVQKSIGEEYDLKIKERDKTISDMGDKLKEAQRKATQGSQQLQGEVLEIDFEEALRQRFPWDEIEEVKKGQRGADVVQRVCSAPGVVVGVLLWEAKRAEKWGGDWVPKAKQDAREAKADVVVIVTKSLPKGIELFGEVDGAWVCEPSVALLLANVLRNGVIEVAAAKRAGAGMQTKAERLYEYMTSAQFRSWLEGIAEPFIQMQHELVSEKRTTMARWKKREKNIERVLESVAGLSGDLQSLAGADLQTLPGFVEAEEGELESEE